MGVLRNILKLQNIKLQLFKPKSVVILLGSIFFAFLGIIVFRNQITTFFSNTGSDPVAYWKFDEGQGSTVNDYIGSNDGTLGTGNSSPTWVTEDQCISGICLRFDGSNDYISHPQLGSGIYGANPRTISFWFKSSVFDTGLNDTIYKLSDGNGSSGTFFGIYAEDNGIAVAFNGHRVIFDKNKLSTNRWYHVAVVIPTGATQTSSVKCYINGVEKTFVTESGSVQTLNTTAYVGEIGTDTGTAGYLGLLDEFKIYDYARTEAQIQADYASRGSTKGVAAQFGDADIGRKLSNGLVGYWNMDAGTGTTITDMSGNNNTGTFGSGGSAPAWTSGKYGSGLVFDGTDDRVRTNLSVGSTTYSISAWINYSDNTYGDIIGKESEIEFYVNGVNSTLGIGHFYTSGVKYWESPTNSLSKNTWHHVMITHNATSSSNSPTMYIDGVAQVLTLAFDNSSGVGVVTSNAASIGAWNSTNNSAALMYKGTMDEVRIYNRVLDPSEVQALYNFAPGPVGYWKMDEGGGTGADAVKDNSGFGNNGTMDASMTENDWVRGKFGKALDFDGVDDYIEVSDPGTNSILDFNNGKQITIMAWFNPDILPSEGQFQTIVTKGLTDGVNDDLNYGVYWGRESGSNDLVFDFCYTNSGGTYHCVVTTNSQAITVGQWHQIAVTYTIGTGSSAKLYFNGNLVASDWFAGTGNDAPNVTNESLWIGADNYGGGGPDELMDGKIDDIRIYNYARTPAQIVSDMNAGHPPPGSPVGSAIVHYKLDEGYGTTINNYGNLGSTLNGTFATGTSAPSWSQDGTFGKAISFDGSSDYISVPDNSALDFNDQDFTISGWFYRDTATTDDMILAKRNGNAAGNQGYMVWVDDTTDKIDFEISDGTDEYDLLSSTTFTTPGWNHFVIVWDDDNAANIEIYVNGKDDNATHTGTLANIGDLSTGNELHLGNVSDNVSSLNVDYYDGLLDEIKIHNFAFTPDQIKTEFNNGKAIVLGAASTGVGGTSPNNSASREYCIPGDSSTCSGPVGEWNFEAIEGTTAYDTSSNGNSGTLTNGPRQTKGKTGKGLYFDGTNDYVDFGDMTSLEGVSQATWSFWIKADAWNIGQIIMGKTNVTTTDISWLINHSSTTQGRMVITIAGSASDLTRYGYVNSVLTGNEWKHITIVFDGSLTGNSNRLKLYINGIQNTLTYGGTIPATLRASSTSTVLGGISGATNYSVRGIMDQVRMYNYARTPAQIAWEYNQGAPVAYYKMDECTGTAIKDWGLNTNGGFNGNTGTFNVGSLGVTSAGTCTTSGAWFNGATGKREASMSFDGSDDYVSVADNALLDITSAMSVSAWVKMDTLREHAFVSKWNGTSNNASWSFATDWTSNDEFYLAVDGDGNPTGAYYVTSTNADLEAGTWYHLTAVWNGTNVTLYKNGVQLSTTTSGSAPSAIYSGAATVNIAAANAGSAALYDGQIDEVKIFNYALTPEQITTEMAGGSVRFQ